MIFDGERRDRRPSGDLRRPTARPTSCRRSAVGTAPSGCGDAELGNAVGTAGHASRADRAAADGECIRADMCNSRRYRPCRNVVANRTLRRTTTHSVKEESKRNKDSSEKGTMGSCASSAGPRYDAMSELDACFAGCQSCFASICCRWPSPGADDRGLRHPG
jgi:hypothetical protein